MYYSFRVERRRCCNLPVVAATAGKDGNDNTNDTNDRHRDLPPRIPFHDVKLIRCGKWIMKVDAIDFMYVALLYPIVVFVSLIFLSARQYWIDLVVLCW